VLFFKSLIVLEFKPSKDGGLKAVTL